MEKDLQNIATIQQLMQHLFGQAGAHIAPDVTHVIMADSDICRPSDSLDIFKHRMFRGDVLQLELVTTATQDDDDIDFSVCCISIHDDELNKNELNKNELNKNRFAAVNMPLIVDKPAPQRRFLIKQQKDQTYNTFADELIKNSKLSLVGSTNGGTQENITTRQQLEKYGTDLTIFTEVYRKAYSLLAEVDNTYKKEYIFEAILDKIQTSMDEDCEGASCPRELLNGKIAILLCKTPEDQ